MRLDTAKAGRRDIMGTKTERKFRFETLQLHVGRNRRIRLRMPGLFPYIRHLPMYFMTARMLPTDLPFPQAVIYTVD